MERLAQFPAVALVGPRQCGKTTLAQALGNRYFDLEQESDRFRVDIEWDSVTSGPDLTVFDEAQCWPELFARLRGVIDRDRRQYGRFLVLGSVAPSLMREVGESLAGRLAVVELTPLNAAEVPAPEHDLLWQFGGFPDGSSVTGNIRQYPTWQESYLRLLVERDLPAWGLPARPAQTFRLFKLLAASHGGIFNASKIGQGLDLSYHTIQSWLDYLEQSFLIRRLAPFHANLSKRLVKSPKIFIRDSGVLHSLLGWNGAGDFLAHPWIGASWEGWVIEQVLAAFLSLGKPVVPTHFRTSDGHEIDLVIERDGQLEAIEIKLTATPSRGDLDRLRKSAALIGASKMTLISRSPMVMEGGGVWSGNLGAYIDRLIPRQAAVQSLRPSKWSSALLFERLSEAAGALVERGIVTSDTLRQRATWLASDIESLQWSAFNAHPTRFVEADGLSLPLASYSFGNPKNRGIEQARDPSSVAFKDWEMEEGGVTTEELLYLSKCCQTAHERIPHLWPVDRSGSKTSHSLASAFAHPDTHLSTLNEIWWLSLWRGLESHSVLRGFVMVPASEADGATPPDVDWRFDVLGGAVTVNLEVKHRPGTHASREYGTTTRLFADKPQKKFRPSNAGEINVLAVTMFNVGFLDSPEGSNEAQSWIDGTTSDAHGPSVDALIVWCPFGATQPESRFRVFFPRNRNLENRDSLLKAILQGPDHEDLSRICLQVAPISLKALIESIGSVADGKA